eukprot:scaffold1051_cov119-Cylindrotheca_fusiformis.AAC.32
MQQVGPSTTYSISGRRRRTRHFGNFDRTKKPSLMILSMVRNIDLAEAIIFYGEASLFHTDDDDKNMLLPGVEYLMEECRRDETAVLAILPPSFCSSSSSSNSRRLEDEGGANIEFLALPKSKNMATIHVHEETQAPPNPRDLWEAIHSIEVQPKGFGGSSGFGRKAADPMRPPLPKHCVVLCHTEDQCRAARYVGTRVLCLTDNALADGVMLTPDDGWASICMDDIATPGSYWLNPPHPKDDDGNIVDLEAVIYQYETDDAGNDRSSASEQPFANNNDDGENELSDDQLAALLADIDPL